MPAAPPTPDTQVSPLPLTPPRTAAPPAPPALGRKFGDHKAVRESLFANALQAAAALPPAENSRYRLQLSDLGYADQKEYGPADQKKAQLEGRTLARRMTGTVTLIDKASGTAVDAKKTTIAHVPYLTNHGVFILNGNPNALSHQLRLDPGVYVRRKGSGEVESHVNVRSQDGVQHRLRLDPKTGVMKVDVGQAELPAYPLLQALGATDKELEGLFGTDLHGVNRRAVKPHHLADLYERLGPREPAADDDQRRDKLKTRLEKARLDPWAVKRTLGLNTDRYGKAVAMAAVNKVLNVFRGTAQPDDRDALYFQTLHGPEHLVPERLERAGPALSALLWQVTNKGNLKPVQPGFLNPAVRSVFLSSGLAQQPESVNALETADHGGRITKVGEGGIGRTSDAVPASARDVSDSHLGFIDAIRTSESENVGLDLRTAFGTRLGADRRPQAPFRDARTNKLTYLNPRQAADAVIAFPGRYNRGAPTVYAVANGRMTSVPRNKVDYVVPAMEQTFGALTNLVPLKSASKPHRASMGARFISQALPLVDPEAPLVRTGVPGQPGKSFEELYGRHAGAVHAHDSRGVVTKVAPDGITVNYDDGRTETHQLHDHFPLGRTTMLHNTPAVKVGDSVQPGQLLATSNNTDAAGHAAYGKNARVGLVPYIHGAHGTYEDATIISQSLADRLTSEHLYQHRHEPDEHTITGKDAYASAFPGRHPVKLYKDYSPEGVIRPGAIVTEDQPLVMAVRREPGAFGVLRGRRAGLTDASLTWDHDTPGEVVDVHAAPHGGWAVTVKTKHPFRPGDKLSGVYGNKGVSAVLPDDHMPHTADGQPLDAIFSSLGITSRVNPSVAASLALGKAAAARGRPYVLDDFSGQGHLARFAKNELAKYGLTDKEAVTDPRTGRTTPPVTVGNMYIMKLSHMASKKVKGHGVGGYDESGTPVRGEEGASRMSLGDTTALVAAGAHNVLRDLKLYRGQDNPHFWAAYMAGDPPPPPTQSRQYARFLDLLRGGGVDPVAKGQRMQLRALSPKRLSELAGDRVVKSADTVDPVSGRPVPGGLFGVDVFGAADSPTQWAKIPLHEPQLNPAFEDPARKLLGLTEAQFRDVIAGRRTLPGGGTGMAGLRDTLTALDVPKETAKAREALTSSRKTARDDAAKRLRYLDGLAAKNETPADWFFDALPVLPPAYRPVRKTAGRRGRQGYIINDMNLLYREVLEADKALRGLKGRVTDLGDEHLGLYDTIKGALGYGDPTDPRNVKREAKGVLRQVFPGSSKHSYVSQRLLGTPADLSGRGQIVPNSDLDMDEIGLPEHLAWQVFGPSTVRRLVRRGFDRGEAVEAVLNKSDKAKSAMLDEMTARPVTVTRYPVLDRFGVTGQKAKLIAGDAIHVNPVIVKSMGGDFDGDTVTIHAPVSDEAVRDVYEKLLPSRNLRSPADFKPSVYLPNMEYVTGLYRASTDTADHPPRIFRTRKDAIQAYNRGEIGYATPIEVLEK